jgi:hypothetical protein
VRKFFEARDQSPRLVSWLLNQIQLIYQIEARLREANARPVIREITRASQTRMIHQRLHKAIVMLSKRGILPSTKLGKAITYALNQWPYLEACLTGVLTRLPGMKASEAASLTPANWKEARTAKAAAKVA